MPEPVVVFDFYISILTKGERFRFKPFLATETHGNTRNNTEIIYHVNPGHDLSPGSRALCNKLFSVCFRVFPWPKKV